MLNRFNPLAKIVENRQVIKRLEDVTGATVRKELQAELDAMVESHYPREPIFPVAISTPSEFETKFFGERKTI